MKKKLISLTLITTIISTLLTGCSLTGSEDDPLDSMSKSELKEAYIQLNSEKDALQAQYDELNGMYLGIQSEEDPTSAISITGDGTGRYTFNSVDSKIIFPQTFQYPGSEQAASSGKINIVDSVTCSPGYNWICKLNGSTLELENTSNISGTIKVGTQSYLFTADELKRDVLGAWFEGLPQSNLVYNNIFIESNAVGVQATTPTVIDSEDAFLRCGMFGYGQYCVTYIFVYRGKQDASKDESITTLLNSMTVDESQVLCEQS